MRFLTLAWPALVLAGCGQVTSPGADGSVGTQIDAAPEPPDPDAAVDPPDAAPTPLCVWSDLDPADFANVNTGDLESSPSFTADGQVVFYTNGPRTEEFPPDVWDAVREAPDQPFGGPRLVGEVSADEGEYDVEIAPAADEIFLVRDTGPNILSSGRVKGGAFAEASDTGLTGTSPSLSGDGLDLYFLDPGNGTILHAARADRASVWGPAEVVGRAGAYRWIDVSANELRVLLSGGDGEEIAAVAIAERDSVEEDFGDPDPAGAALEGGGIPVLGKASWDGRGTQLVIAGALEDGDTDLYYSACE